MRWPPAAVIAAWVFAAVASGVVLVHDAHFVVRTAAAAPAEGARIREVYGCLWSSVVTWEVAVELRRDLYANTLDTVETLAPRARRVAYSEASTQLGSRQWDSDRFRAEQAALRRLELRGSALLMVACLAPLLGLAGLIAGRAGPVLRQVLVVVGALAPLVVLEWFGVAAHARESANPLLASADWSVHATAYTWWARACWSCLALVAVISRWPPRERAVSAVDPATFD